MFLRNRKKVGVTVIIIALVISSIAAISPKEVNNPQPKKRNLKVLPQDISHDSLDELMDFYKHSLNVRCGFCHAGSKTNPKKLDMASDENPIKDIARKMILMTNEMNDKYIHSIVHPSSDSTALQIVTCNTCHRGQSKPEMK